MPRTSIAARALASSIALTTINKSLGVARFASAVSKPACCNIDLFAGVPITTETSITPASDPNSRAISIKATESRYSLGLFRV